MSAVSNNERYVIMVSIVDSTCTLCCDPLTMLSVVHELSLSRGTSIAHPLALVWPMAPLILRTWLNLSMSLA